MERFGYARVSTDGESLDAQLEQLRTAKCSTIFQEKVSGPLDDRAQLTRLLKVLKSGDLVIVYRLREAAGEIDDYRPEQRIHTTLLKELVASKFELLRIVAADGSMRRPDFTIPIETEDGPDIRYWEHWGMLGNLDYDVSVKRRLAWYERHGLIGKLIQSDEHGGFDSTKVDEINREQLLL